MFKHSENRKSRARLPLTILRLSLSLALFLLLGVALIQAFKYFSGTNASNDPFTQAINEFPSNPKKAVMGLLTSEETINVITGILSFSPNKDFKLPLQNQTSSSNKSTSQPAKKTGNIILKFALVADSHKDVDELKNALAQAKDERVKFVIGLGDYSEIGTIDELEISKQAFDNSNLPYYVIPGDHDLWDARDKGKSPVTNFSQVFGTPYQAFSDSGIRFLLLYNSDNYNGVDDSQLSWLNDELMKTDEQTKSIYIFLHEPLVHPTSAQIMGSARKSDPPIAANSKIQAQSKNMLDLFNKAKVGGIFAGDIHAFTTYIDMNTNINMVTVGALTIERNTQSPRFAIVDVYEDGGYNISDIEVK